ncbi:NUDIX domain-containing protein [Candidatus Saccharibacteria bacterium]|nr:MAG: NUDIX domain-containing protein [Candidatus Saccharibacteria bacterium]
MPHIHTEPGQHDLTVSAYIVRKEAGEWKCLVHMHNKLHKLLQVGGHVELTETPWQAIEHELREEAGYSLDELAVLQPKKRVFHSDKNVVHPVPAMLMTHLFSSLHYHTDVGFAFIAAAVPAANPHDSESEDLRWYSLAELEAAKDRHEIVLDVIENYRLVLEDYVTSWFSVPAGEYLLEHPLVSP